MFEQLQILNLFLFEGDNTLFTLVSCFTLGLLAYSIYLLSKKNNRPTAVALCLLSLTPLLYSTMLLIQRANSEVSLFNYHQLIQKTKQSPIYSKIVTEHLNTQHNRLNGIDFARLQYRWNQLTLEEQGGQKSNDK